VRNQGLAICGTSGTGPPPYAPGILLARKMPPVPSPLCLTTGLGLLSRLLLRGYPGNTAPSGTDGTREITADICRGLCSVCHGRPRRPCCCLGIRSFASPSNSGFRKKGVWKVTRPPRPCSGLFPQFNPNSSLFAFTTEPPCGVPTFSQFPLHILVTCTI
jgi:hypothetical protein